MNENKIASQSEDERGSPGSWCVGGGEMARFIRAKDWSKTPLGPMDTWPQSLRTVVNLAQASNSPISLVWGPRHTQIYNDGYWPICAAKHPESMGQDFRECWASAFPVIGEAYASACAGKTSYLHEMRMFLDRLGFLEETWFTFSFSPITDDDRNVVGLFHPVTEMTTKMLSERRTKALGDLSTRTSRARTMDDAYALCAQVIGDYEFDLPFVLVYALDKDKHAHSPIARLMVHAGIPAGTAISPEMLQLTDDIAEVWPRGIFDLSEGHIFIDDLDTRLGSMHVGPYEENPKRAIAVPIAQLGSDRPVAIMIAGLSSRLPVTDAYVSFYSFVASSIGVSLANARAYEEERKRTETLAALDRAKTVFFSNVSHELRTPLTLILAPLEDELAETASPLPPARHERLQRAYRGALRLLKLVNTLLDFSRNEAGMTRGIYEPTDLAELTSALSSMFRSAIERAGVTLEVDCPPLPEPVYVDRLMWEKIVLNLLSNAFKHTFSGEIRVSLRMTPTAVVLSVQDTGIGISAENMPRLFDRFYRVEDARARTHEGTGIGLALVQELAHLHGGQVLVESQVGVGSTFTVSILRGCDHFREQDVRRNQTSMEASSMAKAYVHEALQWLPDDVTKREPLHVSELPHVDESVNKGPKPRVVWADDNADLRNYVAQLLANDYEVEAVGNGAAALSAAKREKPDLILSDVMMPELDGLGLVRAVRADPDLKIVPVILLSARAGEEGAVEGLDAGADDYLAKPFSARDLLARVQTHLRMALARKEWAQKLEDANRELMAMSRTKSEFLANMSHELRTPLNAVVGMSSLLGETTLTAEQRDLVDTIRGSSDHLLTLISDILDFSRIEANQLQLEEQTFRTDDLIESSVDLVASNAAQKGLDLSYLVRGDVPRAITTDQARLRQVLVNLLSNAVKFTERGEVTLTLGAEPLGDGKWMFECAVADTGIGIKKSDADKLFQPFAQADTSIARNYGGTGLGLAISRRLAQAMGGSIRLDSIPHQGSTFYFTFVAREAHLQDDLDKQHELTMLRDRRLLIVDDHAINRELLTLYCKKWGAQVVSAALPSEALLEVSRNPDFAVALIDYKMPEMNGLELAKILRMLPNCGGLPIVLLSSIVTRDVQLDPPFARLSKPIKSRQLIDALSRVVGVPTPSLRNTTTSVFPQSSANVAPKSLRVLVAEDHAINRRVIEMMLKRFGYVADFAHDGVEVLEAIARRVYDLILMDVQMPNMDGFTATREIRRLSARNDVPYIIGITANVTVEGRRACFDAGMNEHIAKPIVPAKLLSAIEACEKHLKGDM